MTDENTNEPTNGEPGPPPPPPVESSPPPVGAGPSSTSGGEDNTVMMILSYLYFFCLVPLFVEKDDPEIQWHAKHGLLLLGADVVLAVAFTMLSVGLIGCLLAPFWALLHFALFVVRIVAIIKGTQGSRLIIPGLSSLADKF